MKKTEPKIEELKQQIEELSVGWQRTQADFANYRRRQEAERPLLHHAGRLEIIESILPVLDNFSLAAKHIPAELGSNNWVIGIQQIEKQLESILSGTGLTKIITVGQHIDPNLHEVVGISPSDRPEGEIVEEIAPGYKFADQVIRPAKVKVSSGSAPEDVASN